LLRVVSASSPSKNLWTVPATDGAVTAAMVCLGHAYRQMSGTHASATLTAYPRCGSHKQAAHTHALRAALLTRSSCPYLQVAWIERRSQLAARYRVTLGEGTPGLRLSARGTAWRTSSWCSFPRCPTGLCPVGAGRAPLRQAKREFMELPESFQRDWIKQELGQAPACRRHLLPRIPIPPHRHGPMGLVWVRASAWRSPPRRLDLRSTQPADSSRN